MNRENHHRVIWRVAQRNRLAVLNSKVGPIIFDSTVKRCSFDGEIFSQILGYIDRLCFSSNENGELSFVAILRLLQR